MVVKMAVPTFSLRGGYKIPVVGFGTAGKVTDDNLEVALETALKNGYRHFDTAYIYENEETIGKVLKKWISEGRVQRDELFIVTKLPFFANTPEKVEACLKESLQRLQLDYVDLYLIHFPVWLEPTDPENKFGSLKSHPTDLVALWKKMEEQVDSKLTRSIGVSNFNAVQITKILKNCRIKPDALQIEVNIYLQNHKLVKFAQDNGIVVVAYSPLGAPGRITYAKEAGLMSNLQEDPAVVKIAAKYHKTACQVMLKYLLQRNIVIIPKSYTPSRIVENIDLFDFVLNEIDLKILKGLDVGERARIGFSSPGLDSHRKHPEWPFWTREPYYAQPNGFF